MRRVAENRQDLPDLLVRRPHIDRAAAFATAWPVSCVDQYRALIDLLDRGLLSIQQFEQLQVRISKRQPR
jgi:hypothetical protein